MNEQQVNAVNCAYAELCGIYQTIIRDGNGHADGHDWEAHVKTIREMEEAFPFIEPIPLTDG